MEIKIDSADLVGRLHAEQKPMQEIDGFEIEPGDLVPFEKDNAAIIENQNMGYVEIGDGVSITPQKKANRNTKVLVFCWCGWRGSLAMLVETMGSDFVYCPACKTTYWEYAAPDATFGELEG